jgi:membrane protease YdiL (CAAX protease family)
VAAGCAVAGVVCVSTVAQILMLVLGVTGNLWAGGLAVPLGGTAVAVGVLAATGHRDLVGLLELHRPNVGVGRAVGAAVGTALVGYASAIVLVLVSHVLLSPLGLEDPDVPIIRVLLEDPRLEVWISVFVLVLVVAPVAEEILFRVVLVEAFRQLRVRLPAVLSALIFGAIHGQPKQVLALGVLAMLLYRLRIRYGSLWPAIVAHSVFNAVAMALAIRQLSQT